MSRRRWFCVLSGLLLGLIVFAGFCVYQARDRGPIRYENLDKVQVGMTLAEVEKLLACPPGNHASGPMQAKFVAGPEESGYLDMPFSRAEVPAMRGGTIFIWHGDRGEINVEFDEEKRVVRADHHQGRRIPSAFWRYLERKLDLDR